jgi:hypothetical protein
MLLQRLRRRLESQHIVQEPVVKLVVEVSAETRQLGGVNHKPWADQRFGLEPQFHL